MDEEDNRGFLEQVIDRSDERNMRGSEKIINRLKSTFNYTDTELSYLLYGSTTVTTLAIHELSDRPLFSVLGILYGCAGVAQTYVSTKVDMEQHKDEQVNDLFGIPQRIVKGLHSIMFYTGLFETIYGSVVAGAGLFSKDNEMLREGLGELFFGATLFNIALTQYKLRLDTE